MGPAQIGIRLLMVFAGQRAPNARTTVFLLFLLQLAAPLIVPWCGSNGSPPELLYLFTVATGASIGGVLIIRALITSEMFGRSEERRVGTGCVSTCRYRWSP